MPTIAELQINLDARPVQEGTKALNEFATAADKASRAGKANQQQNESSSSAADKAAKSEQDLSSMIDAQTRKLEALAAQRRKLDSSSMKSTMPAEYERLNKIIDANISKVVQQGNAIDAVNARQERDRAKRESMAAAELRAQERAANAAVRQENIVSAAASRQQRQIEATINGLSRQVKAQNEYNRTIEDLNRARALSGIGGPGDGSSQLSAGEYDSYVKLAKAKRDAALATEDTSRAVVSAQNKLDTYTATLGKVERAEVEYARAVQVLDSNLKLGNITQEQYGQQLQRFADKRDSAIKAANDNSAAESRFERELRSVMAAYNPILKAQDQYNNSVKILSQGLQSGVISVEQFNKSLTEQREALDGVKRAQSGAKDIGEEYNSALNNLIPYRAELKNLEQQERILQSQKQAGKVTTAAQIADYDAATAAINRQRTELNKRIQSSTAASLSFKQEQAALRGIPAQFTDIVVSLQGGQAPLTVLLQQGGQLKDMFGGIVPALRAMGTYLMTLVNPLTIAGAALAAVGVAAYQGSEEITSFNRAVALSAGFSGTSASQFAIYRSELDGIYGTSSKAAEALTLLEKGGRVTGDVFVKVGEAVIAFSKATGTALSDVVDDFNALGKDPVAAAVRLDEKYRFLTAAVLSQADALIKQGEEQKAVELLQSSLAESAKKTADTMIEQAGYIEKAWDGVKRSISESWDTLRGIGRESDVNSVALKAQQDLLQRTVSRLKEGNLLSGSLSDEEISKNSAVKYIQKQIDKYQALVDIEKKDAEQKGETERVRREAVSAQESALKRRESSLKGIAKAESDLAKVRRENEAIRAGAGPQGLTSEQTKLIAENEARALKDLEDAKEKANKPKKAGALDTTSIQEVKSNLAVINAEYDNYYKKVSALGAANIVSEEATYRSQVAILEAQKNAVSSSYSSQIDEIKKLQANKKNSSAQNISLNNQLTKAEADRAVALEKVDAKLEVLHTKEKGRINERTRNVAAYKAALDAQLESLQEEGARAVDGAGKGDREAGVARQLADNDRSFDKQQRQLAKSLSDGMDPSEYAQKLRALQDAHTEMTEQIIENDRRIQAANSDWTNGFSRAIENARDEGSNFAKSTEMAVTGAFNSMGDALANFAVTGQLNFRSLTISILADLAKIAARQASSQALSALFGVALSAFGGAGANGFAAGSAAANSSATGASQAGYGSSYFPQAKGGAWDSGTKFFAKGGAFTNSVVSSATSFGMAGGGQGVMGEAGPEAIMPLSRTADGSLGVRITGSGEGSGSVIVYVNVSGDGQTSAESDKEGYANFGKEIGDFVDNRYRVLVERDLRAGGALNRAIKEQ